MSLDDLQAQMRGALDQQFAALKSHYETAISEARRQAQVEAEHELQAKLVAARAESEEQLNAQLAAAHAESDERLNAQLAAARAASEERLNAQLASVRAASDEQLQAQLAAARAASDEQLNAQLGAARAAWDEQLNARVAAVRAEAEHAAAQADADLRREFDEAREQVVAAARRSAEADFDSERRRSQRELETERERSNSILEDARSTIDGERQRAHDELEAVRAQLESDLANAREAIAREAAVAAAAKATLATRALAAATSSATSAAMYERVAAGIRTLDGTTALGPALDALVSNAGAIAGRAALFVINGDRLKAWKSAGIPDIDVQTVESSIGGRDLLARTIQSGQPTSPGPSIPAPPFARLPADRPSLAVPLMIGGRAIAVLYVDGGNDPAKASGEWQGAIDLLGRHASALLALRTAMRTFDMVRGVPEAANGNGHSHDEEGARRYAKLLVSEIKLYNEGAVRVGREKRDLMRRLREEIERAQRLYQERVPPAVSARDQYFHQELVQTLADGDASLLGN
jgi:hypothetical protein